ncbi:MAG: GNAT family N-acetyltransferase [Fusobacteriaceae bacterium]|jgi:GNAT superfamily N-acetyltransferase|nr:GNAT family N-acetyltransferase [Fusobacteriaceae bacterium]
MHDIQYKRLEPSEIEPTKNLIREYVRWIGSDLSFQGIEEEVQHFPQKYEAPDGAFFVAVDGDVVVGCVGLKKIGDGICEMKRLYVKDAWKGRGIGKTLVNLIQREALKLGYRKMRLDTITGLMPAAIALYESEGFREIPAYVYNPIEGATFLEKDLEENVNGKSELRIKEHMDTIDYNR